MRLAQVHNTMTPVRLEAAATRYRVKHSTTEPLRSDDEVLVNRFFKLAQVNYCLRHQVLLSVLLRFLTVCQGIRDRGSTARYGLTRTVVRLLPACHVLLEPLTSSYVSTKFGYVYQFPPRFSTVKYSRCVELSPFVPAV